MYACIIYFFQLCGLNIEIRGSLYELVLILLVNRTLLAKLASMFLYHCFILVFIRLFFLYIGFCPCGFPMA